MGVEAQARRLVEEIRQASWPETLMVEDQLRSNDDILTAMERVGGRKDGSRQTMGCCDARDQRGVECEQCGVLQGTCLMPTPQVLLHWILAAQVHSVPSSRSLFAVHFMWAILN
jgi:hypothetical protein